MLSAENMTKGNSSDHRLPHSSIAQRAQQRRAQNQHDHSDPLDVQQQQLQSAQLQVQHQQQQQQQQPGQAATSWTQFERNYYAKDDISNLDTIFYAIHLVMSAIHKRMLVTSREQAGFQVAMSIFAGALLVRLFFKPLYTRIRPLLVFTIHVLLTIVRACVVYTMASKQAVHARPGMVAEDANTAGILLMTMLAILGGPFRLFEMLGLQQPWKWHVLISLLYLAVHPFAALDGIRLAFSNTLFYQVHAVHDSVSAAVDAVLDALTGLPLGQQQTCSSCAGIAVYGFMCLFGSVAVPLYVMYAWEQAAHQRWEQQQHAAAAPTRADDAADTQPGSAAPQLQAVPVASLEAAALDQSAQPSVLEGVHRISRGSSSSQEPRDRCRTTAAPTATSVAGRCHGSRHCCCGSSRPGSRGSSSSSSSCGDRDSCSCSLRPQTRLQAIEDSAWAVAGNAGAVQGPVNSASFGSVLATRNALVRWIVHVLVVVVLMVSCWLTSNAVALVLLPRMLSSKQLERWCPNRPYAPYVIAGQVYAGL